MPGLGQTNNKQANQMTKSNIIKITAKKDYCTIETMADGRISVGTIMLEPDELREFVKMLTELLPENKEYAANL